MRRLPVSLNWVIIDLDYGKSDIWRLASKLPNRLNRHMLDHIGKKKY